MAAWRHGVAGLVLCWPQATVAISAKITACHFPRAAGQYCACPPTLVGVGAVIRVSGNGLDCSTLLVAKLGSEATPRHAPERFEFAASRIAARTRGCLHNHCDGCHAVYAGRRQD